jgi:hypothetical protein
LPSSRRRIANRSSYPLALGLALLPERSRSASRTSMYSCCLSLNSRPTETRARSIGISERRSSAYSLTNVADPGWPASMRITSTSSEGSATFSEVRVVGFVPVHLCVLLSPKDDCDYVPDATSSKRSQRLGRSSRHSIHLSAWRNCLVHLNGLHSGVPGVGKTGKERPYCRIALPKARDLDP